VAAGNGTGSDARSSDRCRLADRFSLSTSIGDCTDPHWPGAACVKWNFPRRAAFQGSPRSENFPLNLYFTLEIQMKAKRLLALPIAAFALMPLAALADGGQEDSAQWRESLHSTRSVQEVRAEVPQRLPQFGDQHPVERAATPESTRSRAEVRAEVAEQGVRMIGA
jgi:hypothetical protein